MQGAGRGSIKRIMVGMSGGVDSAAAALLLQRAGYDVAGATLLLRQDQNAEKEAEDAAAVCRALGIRHRCIDLREAFRQRVMDYFAAEYRHGRTPNPCVECNRHIKFGAMMDIAIADGFDAIATGHYARVERDEAGEIGLYRAHSAKDQSYVLWRLSTAQLVRVVLPLCDMEKPQLRELVRQAGLPVHSKPDSQDICFIPDGRYINFLRDYAGIEPREGAFVDREGREIGRHMGAFGYTIGQRKGLGGGFAHPMFVAEIRPETNTVVLDELAGQFKQSMKCCDLNMIHMPNKTDTFSAMVKPRYSARPALADIVIDQKNATATVQFHEQQRALTPGQSAVFYAEERLLGGGVIATVN